MTARAKPPFRADHVGSLLRPKDLHDARAKNRRGELSDSELKAIQDKDIRDVVKLQEEVGIQAVTDGEFRRDWWHIDFIHGFDGVDLTVNQTHTFHASDEQPPMFKLTGKVRRTKPSMLDHFVYLKSLVTKGTPKFTMPSPAMLHARSDRAALNNVYKDMDEFWAIPPAPTARKSRTSTRRGAATCRSTIRRLRCGATQKCRTTSASSATTRRMTRRCTPPR